VLSLIRELERVGAMRMESIKTHDGTFAGVDGSFTRQSNGQMKHP